MFDVKKQEQKPIVVIRAATPHELSTYEKWKLQNIEAGAEVNKIDAIRVFTPNGCEVLANVNEKIANIELGDLALKNKITSDEISPEELFLIECSLGD